jgi:WD40 repeat protein
LFRSGDKTIIIWSVLTGQLLKRLVGHQRYVTCVTFSSDNRLLASGSNDCQVFIWGLAKQSFAEQPELRQQSIEFDDDALIAYKPSDRVSDSCHWQGNASEDVTHWSIDEVLQWLQNVQLSELQPIFRQHQIDGSKLLHLTHDSLQFQYQIGSINNLIN